MSQKKFGDIEWSGKDIGIPAVPFDKLAISGRGELLLLSVFCDQMRVKQMRAILCGGAKAVGIASGIQVGRPGDSIYSQHTPGRVTPTSDGYHCKTHKLEFGMVHAMFITRMDGFLRVVSEEALWQELTSPRFTTPILREWMPYIESTLREEDQLEDAHAFGCHCGILTATTKSLDEVVSNGLQRGKLIIPRPMAG